MIIRFVAAGALRSLEVSDISQLIVMADSGEPVALAHETPSGALIVSQAGAPDFDQTLASLGGKPAKVQFMKE